MKHDLSQAFELVYDKLTENKHYQYNNQLKERQKVMLLNNKLTKKNKPRKLQYDWIRPMIVIKVLSDTGYNLQHEDKEHKNIRISFIKKYHE